MPNHGAPLHARNPFASLTSLAIRFTDSHTPSERGGSLPSVNRLYRVLKSASGSQSVVRTWEAWLENLALVVPHPWQRNSQAMSYSMMLEQAVEVHDRLVAGCCSLLPCAGGNRTAGKAATLVTQIVQKKIPGDTKFPETSGDTNWRGREVPPGGGARRRPVLCGGSNRRIWRWRLAQDMAKQIRVRRQALWIRARASNFRPADSSGGG